METTNENKKPIVKRGLFKFGKVAASIAALVAMSSLVVGIVAGVASADSGEERTEGKSSDTVEKKSGKRYGKRGPGKLAGLSLLDEDEGASKLFEFIDGDSTFSQCSRDAMQSAFGVDPASQSFELRGVINRQSATLTLSDGNSSVVLDDDNVENFETSVSSCLKENADAIKSEFQAKVQEKCDELLGLDFSDESEVEGDDDEGIEGEKDEFDHKEKFRGWICGEGEEGAFSPRFKERKSGLLLDSKESGTTSDFRFDFGRKPRFSPELRDSSSTADFSFGGNGV